MRRTASVRLIASCLAAAAMPAAALAGIAFTQTPPIAKGVAALPRITHPATPAERRIDAVLANLNRALPGVIRGCRTMSAGPAAADFYWERGVRTTMAGPRFLSFLVTDDYFCGGAHPDTDTEAVVFDLGSGRLVDWRAFLPAAMTGKTSLEEGADGLKTQRLASVRLHELYLKGYPAAADADCRQVVTDTMDDPPSMSVWPTRRGLAVQPELPHVVQACAETVVIPLASLKAAGGNPALMTAIAGSR